MLSRLQQFIGYKYFPPFLLLLFILGIYFKFFLFGQIPFPGDLLVSSYSPWFDYFKFPVKNPVISDVFSQIFPWKYLAIEQFKNLQWPLWNPFSFTGNPLLANYQSAVLYPLNLFLFIPKNIGWGIFIFSQTFIAAFGMYLLLSLWLKSKIAVVAGSIIFAVGGLMTTWLELGTAVHTICWLPLTLFCVEKYISFVKFRYLVFLAFFLSFSLLGGFAQGALYVLLLTSSFILIRANKNFKILVYLFFSIISSLLLSAPQLLPTLDLVNQSIRLEDSYTESAKFGLLPLKEFLKLFSADYFGNASTANYWGFLNYIETSSFLGTLSLPLLIFALLFLKKNRIIIFFMSIFFGSLILAFSNPLSVFIYQNNIPLLTLSYASRILFLTIFSAAVLISFSLDEVIDNVSQYRNFFRCLVWSTSIFLGIIIGTILIPFLINHIIDSAYDASVKLFYLADPDYAKDNFIISLRNLVIPSFQIFLLTFLGAVLYLKRFNSRRSLILTSFLLLLLCLDLGRYFLKITPFVNNSFIFPSTPSIEFLQKQPGIFRIGRENAEVLPPNTWIPYHLSSFEGYDPLYLKNYSRFIAFTNSGILRSSGFGRYAELSQQSYTSSLINLLNVKYFIAILRDDNRHVVRENVADPQKNLLYLLQEKKSGYKVVFHDISSAIVENPNVMPRVFFANSIVVAQTNQEEEKIFNNSFDPKKIVVLSNPLDIKNISGKGEAKILTYSPNKVEIGTKTDNEEILVLSDQFENGWHATVDNIPTKITRADLIFRAVKVSPGIHKVIFTYWPESFDLGLKISLTAFVIILSFSLVFKKRGIF